MIQSIILYKFHFNIKHIKVIYCRIENFWAQTKKEQGGW